MNTSTRFSSDFESTATHASTGRSPVVIIDDDENDVTLATELLRQAGISHPIVHLPDGVEAVTYFETCLARREELPALILLDLKMPRMDGFGVLDWMRERPALAKVKIVILTSSTAERDVTKAMALGAKAFLTKHPKIDQIRTVFQLASAIRPVEEVAKIVSQPKFGSSSPFSKRYRNLPSYGVPQPT